MSSELFFNKGLWTSRYQVVRAGKRDSSCLPAPSFPVQEEQAPANSVSSGIQAANANRARMRSYDPWGACVTMVKFWGNLKWVMASLTERLLGPGSCTLARLSPQMRWEWGAGKSLGSLASELERPQKGEMKGQWDRDRQRLSGSVCVCMGVCVCTCVSFQRRGGGSSPDRGILSSCPCTGLFSSQAINVTAASKAG